MDSGTPAPGGGIVGQSYVRVGNGYIVPHANPNPTSGRNVLNFNPDAPYPQIVDPDLGGGMTPQPPSTMNVKPAIKPQPVVVPPPPPDPLPVQGESSDDLDSLLTAMGEEAATHAVDLRPVPTNPHVQQLLEQQQSMGTRPTKLLQIVTNVVSLPVLYHSIDVITGADGSTPILVLGWDTRCTDQVQPPTFKPCDWDNPLTILIQDKLLTCIHQGISFLSRGYRYTVLFYDPQRMVQVSHDQNGQNPGAANALRGVR